MITPEFIGQIYINTLNSDVWQANSLTPGDWTKIAGAGAGSNLDGAGDPTGVVTPDYVGQYYRDTSTGNIYKSTGATSADWVLTVQDYGIAWSPNSFALGETLGIYAPYDFQNTTDLVINHIHAGEGYFFNPGFSTLKSVSFPNLLDIDPDYNYDATFDFESLAALESISAPLLQATGWDLNINACPLLTSINLDSLVTIGRDLIITGNSSLGSISLPNFVSGNNASSDISFSVCSNLVDVSIPSFLPKNGSDVGFSLCKLSSDSVEHILSRCVANAGFVTGTINISGGSSAAPLQGAGTNHDILVARGVTITHN